jgi:hypothetical protein
MFDNHNSFHMEDRDNEEAVILMRGTLFICFYQNVFCQC